MSSVDANLSTGGGDAPYLRSSARGVVCRAPPRGARRGGDARGAACAVSYTHLRAHETSAHL
eukprot:3829085-Alexandrium_andersonii.AAC.1